VIIEKQWWSCGEGRRVVGRRINQSVIFLLLLIMSNSVQMKRLAELDECNIQDKKKSKKDKKKKKKSNRSRSPSLDKPTPSNLNAANIIQSIIKEQPNYNLTGRLNVNKANCIISNNAISSSSYNEPSDQAKPNDDWRLYCYEVDKKLPNIFYISNQSYYSIGTEAKSNHLILSDPSCSPYHAVIQYRKRLMSETEEILIKPYLIDLSSQHGTYINQKLITSLRYIELLENDCIQFGKLTASSTQFILIKARSS
jgi:hypothetical protein